MKNLIAFIAAIGISLSSFGQAAFQRNYLTTNQVPSNPTFSGINITGTNNTALNGSLSVAGSISGGGLAVSVKAYGATGDGTTDDTLAIKSAIDVCTNSQNKTVYFPPGIYIVSCTNVPIAGWTNAFPLYSMNYSGINIVGNNATIKAAAGTIGGIFDIGSSTAPVNFTMRGMTLDDNQANRIGITYEMISPHGTLSTGKFVITDCTFTNIGTRAITISGDCLLENCVFRGPSTNGYLTTGSHLYLQGAGSVNIDKCFFADCDLRPGNAGANQAIYAHWAGALSITSCTFSNCTDAIDVRTIGARIIGNTILGGPNDAAGTQSAAIMVQSVDTGNAALVLGNRIDGTLSRFGIWVYAMGDAMIADNYVRLGTNTYGSGAAIRLQSFSSPCKVVNNYCVNNPGHTVTYGLQATGVTNCFVGGNYFSNFVYAISAESIGKPQIVLGDQNVLVDGYYGNYLIGGVNYPAPDGTNIVGRANYITLGVWSSPDPLVVQGLTASNAVVSGTLTVGIPPALPAGYSNLLNGATMVTNNGPTALSVKVNTNGYSELTIQNTSNGTNASAGLVWNSDIATTNSYFSEFGGNNSKSWGIFPGVTNQPYILFVGNNTNGVDQASTFWFGSPNTNAHVYFSFGGYGPAGTTNIDMGTNGIALMSGENFSGGGLYVTNIPSTNEFILLSTAAANTNFLYAATPFLIATVTTNFGISNYMSPLAGKVQRSVLLVTNSQINFSTGYVLGAFKAANSTVYSLFTNPIAGGHVARYEIESVGTGSTNILSINNNFP